MELRSQSTQLRALISPHEGRDGFDEGTLESSTRSLPACSTDRTFELSEHVEQIYQRALARYGPVDGELLAVAMMEEDAGVLLRRQPP